jgi:hypothetical protein
MSRIVNGPGGNCYKHRITEQKFNSKPSDRRRMFDAISEEYEAQKWPDCAYEFLWQEMGEDSEETEEEIIARLTEVVEFLKSIEKKD